MSASGDDDDCDLSLLDWMGQSEYARYRGVSRKTVTQWKQRGWLVFGETAGFVDMIHVARTDAYLATRAPINRGGEASHLPEVTARGNSPRKVTGRRR